MRPMNGRAHRSTESVEDWETLPSIPTSINGASYDFGEAKSVQERLIETLVDKIRMQVRSSILCCRATGW